MPVITKPLLGRSGPRNGKGSPPSDLAGDIGHDYRRKVGAYLQDARLRAPNAEGTRGLTQAEVAHELGVWHSAVSSWEVGRASIPPERYDEIATLYGLNRKKFATFLLRYSNPWLYAMMFHDQEAVSDIKHIPDRIMDNRRHNSHSTE